MKKRTLIALLLATILMIGTVMPAAAATAGGWKINHKAASYLTKSEKKVFEKAVKKLDGVAYTPVLTLAEQVVAGTNYAFLCTAASVTASPKYSWKVLIVNRNLKGKAKVLKVNSFNVKRIKTRNSAYKTSNLSGGWAYSNEGTTSKKIPSAAKKAFGKATKNMVGVSLTPLALLATQVVAGTNYKFLCRGVIMNAEGTSCLYEVDVYKDLQGKCEVSSCKVINLSKYLKY